MDKMTPDIIYMYGIMLFIIYNHWSLWFWYIHIYYDPGKMTLNSAMTFTYSQESKRVVPIIVFPRQTYGVTMYFVVVKRSST